MKNWEETLAEVNALRSEIRRRAMIFQHDAKQEYAALLGLDPDSLLGLSYVSWCALQDKVRAFKDRAEHAFKGGSKTLLGDIWREYASENPDLVTAIVLTLN